MSIHLLFNIVTTFVNAQSVISFVFFNACEKTVLTTPLTSLQSHNWAHCQLKIIVNGDFSLNLETDSNHLVSVHENIMCDEFIHIRI